MTAPVLEIPKLTSRTTLTLFTGQTVPVKEVCYAIGKTPTGQIVYRVVYFTDATRESVKGCKAFWQDGWEEFTGSLTRRTQ
jgi:hypothetical protein